MPFFQKKPDPEICLKDFLKRASYVWISFDRLKIGTDNIRYDVRLSPELCTIASKMIFHRIVSAAHLEDWIHVQSKPERAALRDAFSKACREVLFSGIRQAKALNETQIDVLAQTALYKFIIHSIRDQFDILCGHFRKAIREAEKPHAFNALEAVRLKKTLSDMVKNRAPISRTVYDGVSRLVEKIQRDTLKELRSAAFGTGGILPDNFFNNLLICMDTPPEDTFMISEYLLFGHRYEDPHRYDTLVSLVKRLLLEWEGKTDQKDPDQDRLLEDWLGEPDNMDLLFNAKDSLNQYNKRMSRGHSKDALSPLMQRAAAQKQRLDFFYRRFRKLGLIPIVTASYEIQPVVQEYCPPLTPQAVLQFVIDPRSRDATLTRLKRLTDKAHANSSADRLLKTAKRVRRLGRHQKKAYLIRYLKDLSRYHRDLKHAVTVREAMDAIHLVTDEKVLNLSRANNLVYEFLAQDEESADHHAVVNHVVLKADVRGSTHIIEKMKNKGLNPASFFSMNFFEPINRLLKTYEAEKVFIEGDAIILALLERAQPSKNLFTVARACGLAMDILSVMQRYNARSQKARLPVIELGIGIAFQDAPPTYLFDGERRIMISPAINKAHLLCRSDGYLMSAGVSKSSFNVLMVESEPTTQRKKHLVTWPLIYNVNGIALDGAAFRKLSREIDLKTLETTLSDFAPDRLRLHLGKFPTPTGTTRILVIREAPRATADPQEPDRISPSDGVYYEVCTAPALLAWAEKHL